MSAEEPLQKSHLEFLHALWARRVVAAYVLLGLNILVFVLMVFAGGSTNDATLLHIGPLHLLFNCYALWIVGPQVEKLYGTARFFIIYVVTGVAGVYASYRVHPETISAGASGAIFGLFGALLVFGLKYRKSIPPFFQQAVGRGVIPVIIINLIIGFSIRGIDNSAHIGGLLTGAALAAVLPYEKVGVPTHAAFRLVQAILVILIGASFYEVAAHYDGPKFSLPSIPRNWTQLIGFGSSSGEFVQAMNDAQRALDNSTEKLSAITPSSSVTARDVVVLEGSLTKAIDELNGIPHVSPRADELAREFRELAQSQYELVKDIERTGSMDFEHSRRVRDDAARYENVTRDFAQWVESEGSKFGIQLRKQP
jgi:hypothetical protein